MSDDREVRFGLGARIAAAAVALLMGSVMAFQAAVALGAPWGSYTQGGGTSGQLPVGGRIIALVSIVILALLASGLLARVGWGPLARAPRRLVSVVSWIAVGYSLAAVLLNVATPSVNERVLWAPVSGALAACSLVTVIATRRRPSVK